MDLKLWKYIFEMFNYKIRQKKSNFSKLQTLTPPLRGGSTRSKITWVQQRQNHRELKKVRERGCWAFSYVPANTVSPIIGLLLLDRCLGYYRSTNLWFIKARPILSMSFIHQPWIFNIGALVWLSFDRTLLSQCWTDNQATLNQPIFNLLKLR